MLIFYLYHHLKKSSLTLSFALCPEGMDRDNAYTVKDSKRTFTGDQALRRQLTTPKDDLGYCAPLALETGGGWRGEAVRAYCSLRLIR